MGKGERGMKIFSGTSNPVLAGKIAEYLGVPLGRATIGRFSDGEVKVDDDVENVRGNDVFFVQSTCPPNVNGYLMETYIFVDAMKRASAKRITAVLPYYGYGRQDRKVVPRAPISAKLVADLLTAAGIHRLMAMDLHSGQIQGFFNCPVDNLYAQPIFLSDIRRVFTEANITIVSPDAGGVERARSYAKKLGVSIAIIDKRRVKANEVDEMNIIGDVAGRIAVMVDDMADTAKTLCMAADALLKKGAIAVHFYGSHAVLSGSAVDRINASSIQECVFTDSIPLSAEAEASRKIRILTASQIIGEGIKAVHEEGTVSGLFV